MSHRRGKKRMTNNTIMITIPLALTLAQFARAIRGISDDEARELAQEMHDLIAAVQAAYAAHPPDKAALTKRLPAEDRRLPYEIAVAFELGDIIDSMRDTIFGHWPDDSSEACGLSCGIMARLADLDDGDNLYCRYLRLSDRVQGTDFATSLNEERDDRPALH